MLTETATMTRPASVAEALAAAENGGPHGFLFLWSSPRMGSARKEKVRLADLTVSDTDRGDSLRRKHRGRIGSDGGVGANNGELRRSARGVRRHRPRIL